MLLSHILNHHHLKRVSGGLSTFWRTKVNIFYWKVWNIFLERRNCPLTFLLRKGRCTYSLQLFQERTEHLPHTCKYIIPCQDLPCMCSEYSTLPLTSHVSSNRPKAKPYNVENGAPTCKNKVIVKGCYSSATLQLTGPVTTHFFPTL